MAHNNIIESFLTFFVSAVVHEYVFAVAASRIYGYQTAFFMIHGAGVAASGGLNRFARRYGLLGTALAHTATILFLLLTSILFFASADKILPSFYTAEAWLP